MRPITIACAAAALMAALAGPAWAQSTTSQVQPSPAAPEPLPPEPEGFNLTPFLGVGFSGNLENSPAAFGVAVGYGLTPRVVVEGELSFAPGGEQGVITEFDTSVWSLSANVLYHFIGEAENFTPYAVGGLGVLNGDADVENITPLVEDDTSSVFSWNLGGGVKTAMNENWGLRADLRFFNGKDFAPDHWRLYGGVVLRRIGQW
jgi:opacity protein-like surface antigen